MWFTNLSMHFPCYYRRAGTAVAFRLLGGDPERLNGWEQFLRLPLDGQFLHYLGNPPVDVWPLLFRTAHVVRQ